MVEMSPKNILLTGLDAFAPLLPGCEIGEVFNDKLKSEEVNRLHHATKVYPFLITFYLGHVRCVEEVCE